MTPADVVVVGNAGVDTEVLLPRAFDPAADSQFVQIRDVVGQAGGYSARGFARLGRRTRFLGSLGDDWAGALVREALAADGVLVDAIVPDPAGTARSANLIRPDGGRNACYDGRGHLDLVMPADVAASALAGSRLALVHLANWARLVLPLVPGVLSVDLQDVHDLHDPYRADFIEAAQIVFMSGAHLPDPAAAAWEMVHRGRVRTVVVGIGADGVLAVVRGGEVQHFPAPRLDLPMVDSNGAGDSLAVGFLDAYVLDGAPLAEAVQRGQLCARWCCSVVGSDGLADREALRSLTTP